MFGFHRKNDLFDTLYGGGSSKPAPRRESQDNGTKVAVSRLPGYQHSFDTGDKWTGGFGPTRVLIPDYWTLRTRSIQLFETNLYARGLIRRMVTNEINVGLHLEATPEEAILGLPEDSLADWSEDVENRFTLWAKDPYLCDYHERHTFGQLQKRVRRDALVAGDVLVVMRQHQATGLPRIQLISGSAVQTPYDSKPQTGNTICHGVEIDKQGRHVAYWVRQDDGRFKRLPVWGEKSGRRIAWLVYGTDKRIEETRYDGVRGKPLLALVLQSLAEIDRFRDSTQSKARILSSLVGFVSKGEDKPGTRPITGGAIRRGVETTVDSEGRERTFKVAEHNPNVWIDELQHGEEPKAFQINGTIESFGDFEDAVICAVAWANEVPPEILKLSFNSNYSASQAATNEYKNALNPIRTEFGENFCTPVYQDWLLSEALAGKIQAQGLLEAYRDPKQYDIYGAWVSSGWAGQIKPAIDLLKLANGSIKLLENGLSNRDLASREITGTKFSKNVKRLKLENAMLAEAMKPLVDAGLVGSLPAPQAAPNSDDESPDDVNAEPDDKESLRVIAGGK